ncbi:MAG: hypothetical protein R3296_07185 [Oleiphilaceae bacterium]|nr:hypothetical protein [Oleiphilaceae bacterium]
MPSVHARNTLSGLVLILFISGCSVLDLAGTQPEGPTPEEDTTTGESRQPDCQWQATRGVAQLVEKLNGKARFEFFPGEQSVKAPYHSDWRQGEEFKAVLRQSDREGCGPEIDIMESLEPT